MELRGRGRRRHRGGEGHRLRARRALPRRGRRRGGRRRPGPGGLPTPPPNGSAPRRPRHRRRRAATRPTSPRSSSAPRREVGPIDLFVSNAGIGVAAGHRGHRRRRGTASGRSTSWPTCTRPASWCRRMLERGGGYLLNTASAAGLLTQIGDAPYSVTKHARRRPRRVAGDHLRRPGHQGVVPVPPGRATPTCSPAAAATS